jgi:hypothetical protein
VDGVAESHLGVELLEHLARYPDAPLAPRKPHLVAAGVGRDLELLLENLQASFSFAVQLSGYAVVVEDEGLSGRGLVGSQ